MSRVVVMLTFLLVTVAPGLAGEMSTEAPATQPDAASAFTVGFGVSPLRAQLPAPLAAVPGGQAGDSGRPVDFDSNGTALSFDFKLRWPGGEALPLEPYMTLGPALFVVEPDYASRLLGTRVDPTFRLGAKAGAGLNWRLTRDLTLFGAYEVTTPADSALPSFGARSGADSAVGGHDFTYGLRLRY
jgi:hypothetical protein